MTKSAEVTYNLDSAWERWRVILPDDAPDDPEELTIWLENNPDEVEFVNVKDSGSESMQIAEVELD